MNVEFRIDGDAEMIEMEIEMGRPVLAGWLHKGSIDKPQCDSGDCGHWSLITGYKGKNSNDPRWVMQDPRGKPDLLQGGHFSPAGGEQVEVRQSEFSPRWEVDGPGTGWVILVDES